VARPKEYDFDKILPEICEEYIDTSKSLKNILKERGGPEFSYFYRVLSANPEYQAMWLLAEKTKAASLDDDYIEIQDMARQAFYNKDLNAGALKTMLDTTKTRRGQLDARFRSSDVTHKLEAGESMRALLTERGQRADERVKLINDPIEGEYEEKDGG